MSLAKVRWTLTLPGGSGAEFAVPSLGGRPKMTTATIEVELADPSLAGSTFQELYSQLQKQMTGAAVQAANGATVAAKQAASAAPTAPNHNPVSVMQPGRPAQRSVGPRPSGAADPNAPRPIPTQGASASNPRAGGVMPEAAARALGQMNEKFQEIAKLTERLNAADPILSDLCDRVAALEAWVRGDVTQTPVPLAEPVHATDATPQLPEAG